MMTPRGGSGGSSTLTSALGSGSMTLLVNSTPNRNEKVSPNDLDDRGEKRKKKKSYYAKLKRQEDDKMAELAAKYRDRAKERRDGGDPARPEEATSQPDANSGSGSSGAYRAVAPDVKGNFDAAERRRQMIQESKFLGGDMEHTHLVKGLDFALLQKVRSEIMNREKVEKDIGKEEDTDKEKEKEAKASTVP